MKIKIGECEKFDGVIIIDNEFTIFENGDVSHNILLSDVNDKPRFKELCLKGGGSNE